jgi:uncharacterized protein
VHGLANEIHEFFSRLGVRSVGFNIEEVENANLSKAPPLSEKVLQFWTELYKLWSEERSYEIRDLSLAEAFLLNAKGAAPPQPRLSLIPTVDTEGNVFLLSPEIPGTKSAEYRDFICGNLKHESLASILTRAREIPYIQDFLEGVQSCKDSCPVFSACQSRHVLSNKFAEHGHLKGTETSHCRNTYLLPVQAVLSVWSKATPTALTVSVG